MYKSGLFVHTDCQKLTNLDGVFSAVKYSNSAKTLLRLIKYDGYHQLIQVVVDLCLSTFANLPFGYDFVVPIPLHPQRQLWRGFNQAELLAKKLTRNSKNILERTRNTKPQAHLNKLERLSNAQDAFGLVQDFTVLNKRILLVDDVYTTGSTAENCALVLKSAGAQKVYLYTWASGT